MDRLFCVADPAGAVTGSPAVAAVFSGPVKPRHAVPLIKFDGGVVAPELTRTPLCFVELDPGIASYSFRIDRRGRYVPVSPPVKEWDRLDQDELALEKLPAEKLVLRDAPAMALRELAEYDENGRRTRSVDGTDETVYEYDRGGRLASMTTFIVGPRSRQKLSRDQLVREGPRLALMRSRQYLYRRGTTEVRYTWKTDRSGQVREALETHVEDGGERYRKWTFARRGDELIVRASRCEAELAKTRFEDEPVAYAARWTPEDVVLGITSRDDEDLALRIAKGGAADGATVERDAHGRVTRLLDQEEEHLWSWWPSGTVREHRWSMVDDTPVALGTGEPDWIQAPSWPRDSRGRDMKFVAQLASPVSPVTYYLFYSRQERLVTQVSQMT